jgi:hypothetical protein
VQCAPTHKYLLADARLDLPALSVILSGRVAYFCTCCCTPLWAQSGHYRTRSSVPFKSEGWNHHLQCNRPQRSRQQLRPQPPPQPGPQPRPPAQRTRPQRSRQQRRPHWTSVILSKPAVAAAESGRIGAAWVVTEPLAKIRPVIPTAKSMRNIGVTPFFHGRSTD